MKGSVLFLVVFVSFVELRRHSSDLYGLDDLLNRKRDRPQHYSLGDDNDDDEQESRSIYEMDTPERQAEAGEDSVDEPKRARPSKPHRVASFVDDDETTTKRTTSANPSACFTDYETRAEQLVKVKDLKNNERLIRVALIDKASISSGLKDACMQHCCSQDTCDLAMLSEQHTHVSHRSVSLSHSLSRSGRLQMLPVRLQWKLSTSRPPGLFHYDTKDRCLVLQGCRCHHACHARIVNVG